MKTQDQFYVGCLSPGTRSVLLRFEKAVRELGAARLDWRAGTTSLPEQEAYTKAKRAVVRRLRRIEGTLPPDTRGRRKKVLDHTT